MDRVTLRLPSHVIRAYDEADGNRSAVMRRRLIEAVEDGEVQNVPEDLRVLASREASVDRGVLDRKRGKFREEAHNFFQTRWENGATPPSDVEAMAESWRQEGALYGEEYLSFVEAIVEWFTEEWRPINRPSFPDPGAFIARAEDAEVNVDARLVETMREARDEGVPRAKAVTSVSKFHDDDAVREAARRAYDAEGVEAGEQ